MEQRKYGFFTATTMIVGIVIGSGIFFRSDNVLVYTGGNVLLGALVFTLAAVNIIFGSLSIAQLASLSDKAGGAITYAEQFCSKGMGCVFGWFQSFLYYPTLVAVVSWVSGIYTCILFDLPMTLENQVLIGTGATVFLYVVNILSARLGGWFQNAATIIKLIPLILIALAGIFIAKPGPMLISDAATVLSTAAWVSAIVPIAFSFDGWIIATSVGHEIKNSKRNLPLALVVSPLIILAVYLIYFIGISALVGPEKIMQMGDAHVDYAANLLFGPVGAKVILVFVIISVLGTVNGLILGLIRVPYSLAVRGMLPGAAKLGKEGAQKGFSVASALLTAAISLFWILVHYLTQKFEMLPNSDISEISIVFNYVGFIILYVTVMRLARRGQVKGIANGYIFPALAILGSGVILMGGISNPLFVPYALMCTAVVAAALLYYRFNKANIQ